MVRITEDLLRKKAEHNQCELFSLEEISLHQLEIERIELLDKVCRDLKIVYLQSNLIPRIENVSRLKKLEYLNLALNNITKVENLEGCESLKKLDLTVNFVAELTSIECLQGNYHFTELFLTGNPCTDYEGYRDYVVATLDQLQWLDGKEIERSERILAKQTYEIIRGNIIQQQNEYFEKREKEKMELEEKRKREEEEKKEKEKLKSGRKNPGFDGSWYTDIPSEVDESKPKSEKEKEEEERKYWEEKTDYTPESRLEVHKHIEQKRREKEEMDAKRVGKAAPKRETKLFADDGRVMNLNQGKWDFRLTDDEENNKIVLDLPCYKYLDTSLIDVDIQPTYIRVTVKGKVFQLVLPEEVMPDASTAQRSQTTEHLLVTMPKAKQVLRPVKKSLSSTHGLRSSESRKDKGHVSKDRVKHEKLEVDPSKKDNMDFSCIVQDAEKLKLTGTTNRSKAPQKEESDHEDFIDDPDVPPLM